MKCAVVYYSKTGVTKRIADQIQAKFNADIYPVEPEKAYGGFLSSVARVVGEKISKKSPALKTAVSDFAPYDIVFIGFPVWAGTVPDFMQTYIRKANLAGKRIIPFATASTTGKESSLKTLKALLPDSTITDYFYTNSRQPADVQTWLDGIK
ncbi:MAG: hypothetical protein IKO95_06095 [Spirochaetia bacterium]|nr:hypothetical protein [Spirochaetia bacterium]